MEKELREANNIVQEDVLVKRMYWYKRDDPKNKVNDYILGERMSQEDKHFFKTLDKTIIEHRGIREYYNWIKGDGKNGKRNKYKNG